MRGIQIGTEKRTEKLRNNKSYLLFPKRQLKYAFLYCALIALLGLVLICLQQVLNNEVLTHLENSEQIEIVTNLQNRNLILQVLVLFLSTSLIFLITIVMTHRFVGPMIALIRYFESIRLNGKVGPLVLRREDELEPLITYLNSVEVKISKRDPL